MNNAQKQLHRAIKKNHIVNIIDITDDKWLGYMEGITITCEVENGFMPKEYFIPDEVFDIAEDDEDDIDW